MSASIALLVHDAGVRARVSTAVGRDFELRSATTAAELLALVDAATVDLVVIDALDREGRSLASTVAAIRLRFATMPILVSCALSAASSAAILDVAKLGVTGLLIQGVDDGGHAIRAAVRSARFGSVTRRIYAEIAPRISPPLRPLLLYAMSRTADDPSVADAADTIGVDRKTLVNWMRPHGQLSPRQFINWVRLSIGVGLLQDHRRTAEQVALELGFASGTAFRNMLTRYTGKTSAAIRQGDGFSDVLATFSARLAISPLASPGSVRRRA